MSRAGKIAENERLWLIANLILINTSRLIAGFIPSMKFKLSDVSALVLAVDYVTSVTRQFSFILH